MTLDDARLQAFATIAAQVWLEVAVAHGRNEASKERLSNGPRWWAVRRLYWLHRHPGR